MEWHQILQAVFALIFVIGLLFVTLWLFKFCEQKGLKSKLFRELKSGTRINILERRGLDARNRLVLIKADDTEYLLLLGQSGNLLLDSKPSSGQQDNE